VPLVLGVLTAVRFNVGMVSFGFADVELDRRWSITVPRNSASRPTTPPLIEEITPQHTRHVTRFGPCSTSATSPHWITAELVTTQGAPPAASTRESATLQRHRRHAVGAREVTSACRHDLLESQAPPRSFVWTAWSVGTISIPVTRTGPSALMRSSEPPRTASILYN
jgi:hypothetical protein